MLPVGRWQFVIGGALMLVVASCGTSGGEPEAAAPVKPPVPGAVTIAFPSTVVPAHVERTQCVVLSLGNATPLRIGSVHNVLEGTSHHLVVYRVSDTVERRTPFPCEPFSDTLDPAKGSTLMVTQKQDDLLTLPQGVAYSMDANQMIRLELHYVNPSGSDKTVSATSVMQPIAAEDFRDEAGFLFIGNPDFKLAPRSEFKLGPTFFKVPTDLSGVKFFAITGHEHQLGTNVQVATAANADDAGKMVYDVPNWIWSEPKTEFFETPFTIPDDGGFKFTCSWNNVTDKEVRFGESTTDEMCFFWAYYYPSQGAKVCFHTARTGASGGTNFCCPGDLLCSFVTGFQGSNP